MGSTTSNQQPQKEEIIIAQTGAGNSGNSSQSQVSSITYHMLLAILIIVTVLFSYFIWKNIHKCLTKRLSARQQLPVYADRYREKGSPPNANIPAAPSARTHQPPRST